MVGPGKYIGYQTGQLWQACDKYVDLLLEADIKGRTYRISPGQYTVVVIRDSYVTNVIGPGVTIDICIGQDRYGRTGENITATRDIY
jgi:hypothetical protein